MDHNVLTETHTHTHVPSNSLCQDHNDADEAALQADFAARGLPVSRPTLTSLHPSAPEDTASSHVDGTPGSSANSDARAKSSLALNFAGLVSFADQQGNAQSSWGKLRIAVKRGSVRGLFYTKANLLVWRARYTKVQA